MLKELQDTLSALNKINKQKKFVEKSEVYERYENIEDLIMNNPSIHLAGLGTQDERGGDLGF